ncbi:MAG: histidine phosphatase family protein [Cyclobacteriaceae bacterium]
MVKSLYLIRHAEAVSAFNSSSDYSRNLTDEGIIASSQLGAKIKSSGFVPDLILSSPATRARQTIENIVQAASFTVSITFDEDIYEASVGTMLKKVNQISSDIRNVIIVGHNPTISFFAEYLTNDLIGNVSPGQLVKINFGADYWNMVSKGSGYLKD